jgi:hypothetical protein
MKRRAFISLFGGAAASRIGFAIVTANPSRSCPTLLDPPALLAPMTILGLSNSAEIWDHTEAATSSFQK